MSEKIRRITMVAIFVVLFLAANIAIYQSTYRTGNKGYTVGREIVATEAYSSLSHDIVLEQDFTTSGSGFAGIGIKFHIFGKKPDSSVLVSIRRDSDQKVIASWTLSEFLVQNDEYYDFFLPATEGIKGDKYTVIMRYTKVDEKDFVAPFYTRDNKETLVNEFRVNGQTEKGSLAIREYYERPEAGRTFGWAIVIYLIATVLMLMAVFFWKADLNKTFLPLAIILGILYMITTPIFRVQDEDLHFYRAYEVSTGHMTSDLLNDIGGRMMPSSLVEIMQKDVRDIKYEDTIRALDIKLEPRRAEFIRFPNASLYSPLCYLPQAAGIALARSFGLGPMWMAYAGRIFNLIVWALMMKMALEILYFGKRMLFLLALSPMSLFTAASLSADALTNALALLFIAFVFYLAYGQEERVNKRQAIFLGLLCFGIALCKLVYLPLCLLCFIIPKEKFGGNNWRRVVILGSMLLGATALNLGWLQIASKYRIDFINAGTNTPMQISHVLSNPGEFIVVMTQTMATFFNFYIQSLFGASLGWFDVPVYPWISVLYLLTLVLIVIMENSETIRIRRKDKVLMLGVIAAIVALVFASLYVSWTRVADPVIDGVQGRYFLPIIPLILLLFNNTKIKAAFNERTFNFYISAGAVLLQFPVLLTLLVFHI